MKMIALILGVLLSASLPVLAADDGVARVNGAIITARQLEQEVDSLIPRSTFHGNVTEERRKDFREKALNDLIDRELKYQDAVAKGMKPDKQQVKDQMSQIRDRFKSKKEYKDALAGAGLNEDGLREIVEKGVLVQQVIAKTVKEPARMSEEDVRAYYNKHIEKFMQPESVRLRLLSTKDKKKAEDALARIKGGEDFGKVAAKVSEDDYRIKGGDIGYIHKGRVLEEIERVAFALKKGEVSSLISAGGIWYVIKVEDKKPQHQLSYEDARDKLKQDLENKRSDELNEKWMSDLRARAKIEIFRESPSIPTEKR